MDYLDFSNTRIVVECGTGIGGAETVAVLVRIRVHLEIVFNLGELACSDRHDVSLVVRVFEYLTLREGKSGWYREQLCA